MAKIAKIIILFYAFLCLSFGNVAFQNFDSFFDISTKEAKQSFHNQIKDVYLEATISGNKDERLGALKRLIKSSKELGLNHTGYENELVTLESSSGKVSNSEINLESLKPTSNTQLQKEQSNTNNSSISQPQTIDLDGSTPLKATKSKEPNKEVKVVKKPEPQTQKEQVVKNKEIKQEETQKKSQILSKKKLQLLGIDKTDDGVVLRFNRPVLDSEMKHFVLKGDVYRNIIDFRASNFSKTARINDHLSDEIRIAQFDKEISRFVVSRDKQFEIGIKNDNNNIFIAIKGDYKVLPLAKKEPKVELKQTTAQRTKPKQEVKQATRNANKRSKVIVLDPGHGGKDPGAVGGGLREKDIVLNIAKLAGEELKSKGYKVLYTRSTDKFINLKNRTAYANKNNADMFVSIHVNAGPSTSAGRKLSGLETFFLSPARSERSKNAAALENKGDIEDMNHFSKETYLNFLNREKIIASNKLAIDIQKHMLNSSQRKYSVKDGGVREAPFWVLVGATMPAVLIEAGYISNSNDSKNLGKKEYQRALAKGIANGIDAYFLKN